MSGKRELLGPALSVQESRVVVRVWWMSLFCCV